MGPYNGNMGPIDLFRMCGVGRICMYLIFIDNSVTLTSPQNECFMG
jgi:hypothetical protein